MVAFMCNKPAMYLSDSGWQSVKDVDCLHDPADILNFCRRVYPEKQVTNVVESSSKVTIGNWCQIDNSNCQHPEHTVTPYKCVVGAFHSEALLVPEHCVFDHMHEEQRCQTNAAWRQVADTACIGRGMAMDSSAPLSICGIDKFQGVEYVCCPTNKAEASASKEESVEKSVMTSAEEQSVEEDKNSEEASSSEELSDYSRYLHKIGSELLNEHEFFLRAKNDLHRQHREKINKIMEEWNAAKKHVEDMKKTDVKASEKLSAEVTERFQKTYEALDQEHDAQTKQLLMVHEERVQAALNKKRLDAINKFRSLLVDEKNEEEVVKSLQHYIRVEQKVRLHDINRYEHLADRDPLEADAVRQQFIDHLHLVDVRIQETLDLLKKLPKLEKKIRVQMDEFLKSFHDIDAGVARILAEQVEAQLQKQPLPDKRDDSNSNEEKSTEKSVEVPTEKVVSEPISSEIAGSVETVATVEEAAVNDMNDWQPPEPQFESNVELDEEAGVAHHEINSLQAEQRQYKKADATSHTSIGHGAVVGIAVGTVTVFIVLIVGLTIIRRRPYDMTVSHTVDENTTPEGSHLSQMQSNGYENPTYKYFEMRTGNNQA